MPRPISRIAALFAALAPFVSAVGQPNHPQPAERNAALQYALIFYTDLPKELTDKTDDADLTGVGLETDPAKQPEKYKIAAQAAKERSSAVTRLVYAANLPKCDFEIAYEQGINALLPHLSGMRKAARLLRLDARRALLEGSPDDAADRVAAIYRMSGQLKRDEIMISTLVAVAIAGLGNSETEVLVNSGKLTASGREKIMAAIAALGETDPFGFHGALRGERRISLDWVRATYTGPGAGKRLAESIQREWGMNVENPAAEIAEIKGLDEDGFARGLGKLDTYHDLMLANWDLPDAVSRLEVLGSRCSKGEFGPFAKFLAPTFAKARSAAQKNEAELLQARTRLAGYTPPVSSNPAPASQPK